MKNIFYLIIAVYILCSCGSSNQNKSELDGLYKIVSVKESSDLKKCTIEIELKEKVSKDTLIAIGDEIHATRKSYDKVWMLYYVPRMKPGSGAAWATTNYTPGLSVEIIGSTKKEEVMQKDGAIKVDGDVIGEYYSQQLSISHIVYERNHTIYMKMICADGSKADYKMRKRKVANGTRLDYTDKGMVGEYFILNKSDQLEFYNAENKRFAVANGKK